LSTKFKNLTTDPKDNGSRLAYPAIKFVNSLEDPASSIHGLDKPYRQLQLTINRETQNVSDRHGHIYGGGELLRRLIERQPFS
jgi:hypothetical protein